MKTTFFFHKMKSSRRLQTFTSKKINDIVDRFVTKLVEVRVAFEFDAGEYVMTCHVTGGDGFDFHVKTHCEDPYGCVDLMAPKLERVLRRHKTKIKSHRGITARKHIAWDTAIDAFGEADYPEYKDLIVGQAL